LGGFKASNPAKQAKKRQKINKNIKNPRTLFRIIFVRVLRGSSTSAHCFIKEVKKAIIKGLYW
jgi:hypothetical protein